MVIFRDNLLKVTVSDIFCTWEAKSNWVINQWVYLTVTWHHLFGVYIFINGHQMAIGDQCIRHQRGLAWTSVNGDLTIGCPSACTNGMNFWIDELKFQAYAWIKEKIRHEYGKVVLIILVVFVF